jgi:hypothetical protein
LDDDARDDAPGGWWGQAQWAVAPALELLIKLAPGDLGERAQEWAPLADAARRLVFTTLGLVGRARALFSAGDLTQLGDLLDEAAAVLVEDLSGVVDAFPDVAEVLLGAEAIERVERSILSREASRALALDALGLVERRADLLIARLVDVLLSPSTAEELSSMASLLEQLEATAQRLIDEVIVPRVERAARGRFGRSSEEE